MSMTSRRQWVRRAAAVARAPRGRRGRALANSESWSLLWKLLRRLR